MKVSDILRVKGSTLIPPCLRTRIRTIETMAEFDIGSLAVMEDGKLAGMLTFSARSRPRRRNAGTSRARPSARSWTGIQPPVRPTPSSSRCVR